MTKADLERIRDLAVEKLTTGNEPPWVWYQLMKLREASEALIAGMDATQPMAGSPESERRQGAGLRLVAATCQRDSAQRHPETIVVHLPT